MKRRSFTHFLLRIRRELILIALATLLIWVTATNVPWNMDEFLPYHSLVCRQPAQQLNTFVESCFAYATNLGPIHFFRSYLYVGVSSSILYSPFYAITSSIWMHYFVGACALAATAWGLKKSFGFKFSMIPAMAMFFPLMFTQLHDAGPVRIGLLVMAWSPVVVAKYFNSTRFRYIWVFLLSIMWVVATEDKPFFLFLIPGIAIFTLVSLANKGMPIKDLLDWHKALFIFGIPLAVCISLLSFMQTNGTSYLVFLSQQSPAFSLGTFLSSMLTGLMFTLNWTYYAHRVTTLVTFRGEGETGLRGAQPLSLEFFPSWYTQRGTIAFALVLAGILTVTCLLLWVIRTRMGQRFYRAAVSRSSISSKNIHTQKSQVTGNTFLMLVWAFALLILGTTFAGGSTGHHFVYTSIPLLVSFAFAFEKWLHGGFLLGILLATLSTISLITISLIPVHQNVSKEIDVVARVALSQADQSTIVNCYSWGCYYTYSFLNYRQIPVVFAAESESNTIKFNELVQSRGSSVMHICLSCDQKFVQSLYPRGKIEHLFTDTKLWQVFRVTL
jgi:hypothetical protein